MKEICSILLELGRNDGFTYRALFRFLVDVGYVWELNYFTVTRSNIYCSVNVVSQFMQSPDSTHNVLLDAVVLIFRTVKREPGQNVV